MVELPKGFFLYTKFDKPTTSSLLALKTPDEIKSVFASLLKVSSSDIKDQIFVDHYFNSLTFCVSRHFTEEKTSCFLALMDFLITSLISHRLTNNQSFEIFKQLLLRHSIQRSPYSIAVFPLEDVKAITDYCLLTYFRHYSLYEYVFTPKRDVVLSSVNKFDAVFPHILGLMDGLEINPEELGLLDEYLVKEEEEPPQAEEEAEEVDVQQEETPEEEVDPVQAYLNQQMALLKAEMDSMMKAQDEEFNERLEALKKQ